MAALLAALLLSISAVAVARTWAQPASGVRQMRGPAPSRITDLGEAAKAADTTVREQSQPLTSSERRAATASREQYADLGSGDALALAEQTFGTELATKPWEPLRLAAGQRVKEYRGAREALLVGTDGHRTLAQSTLPMRSEVGDGDLAPVDLSLERKGDEIAPANPLVDTTIAIDEPGSVSFDGEHATVSLSGTDDDVQPQRDDDRVFLADALDDTDVLLRPTPAGVSYSFVVRSQAAPQSATLDFELPADTILRSSTDVAGAVEIVTDGKPVGIVQPPQAWDADHRDVPVRYAIDGDRVTVSYAFEDPTLRFPLYVDPVIDWYRVYGGDRTADNDLNFTGWEQRTNRPGVFGLSRNGSSYGAGLYSYTLETSTYNNGDYAQWAWQVPRSQSYIESVDFGYLDHNWGLGWNASGGFAAFTCIIQGVYGDSDWNYGVWRQKTGYPQPTISVSSPWTAANTTTDEPSRNACHAQTANFKNHTPFTPTNRNSAIIGIQVVANTTGVWFPAAYRGLTHLYGATLYLNDRQIPTTTAISPAPTNWVNTGTAVVDVTATDAGGLGIRSLQFAAPGQAYVSRFVDSNGQAVSSVDAACYGGGYNGSCPQGATAHYAIDYGTLAEGASSAAYANAYDAVGKLSNTISSVYKVDHHQPDKPTIGGTAFGAGVVPGQTYNVTASASDALSGVNKITMKLDGVPLTSLPGGVYDRGCANVGCSPTTATMPAASISTAGMAYGSTHTVTATPTDAVGITGATESRTFTITDTTPPTLSLGGSATTVPASGRDVVMTAQDAQQGMRYLRAWIVDPGATPAAGAAPQYDAGDLCPSAADCTTSPVVKPYTLGPEVTTGLHDVYVRAIDAAGNVAFKSTPILVVDLRRGTSSKLGLEQWFDYDETPAGGDSNVYVNADNGNAVWHQVPIVDPGRGLSTVVNLTYNSQDRGGLLGTNLGKLPVIDLVTSSGLPLADDLLDASYSEVGPGFSLGISGPTRVNEPLRGVLYAQALDEGPFSNIALPSDYQPQITLTDADGTRHTFTRGTAPGSQWQSPPGLDLRLRRFAPGGDLLHVVTRKWAMTRPDGVTYFFDSLGYLTSIEDRNANKVSYDYELYNALLPTPTGNALCTLNDILGDLLSTTKICARRLKTVTDPAGRTLTIGYRSGSLVDTVLPGLTPNLPLAIPGLIGGRPGRISSITDNISGRTYTFDYDTDGFLSRFVEAAGETDPSARRVTDFKYEPWSGPLHLGEDRLLTDIVEMERKPGDADYVERSRTTLGYESKSGLLPLLGINQPRKVTRVTKRDGTPKDYAYPRTATQSFTVGERASAGGTSAGGRTLAPLVLTTAHKLDSTGKPTDVTNPNGTTTHLEWDDAINEVTAVTVAHGSSPDQASRTEYSYDTSKQTPVLLRKREFPNYPSSSGARDTTIGHDFSAGVPALQSSAVAEADGTFVADVTGVTPPKAGTGWTFALEPGHTGNVVGRTDAKGYTSTTAYTTAADAPLPRGLIKSETDENGDTTTYSDWHPTGLPGTVRQPTEPGKPAGYRTWTYAYNGVGDVTAMIDPRATDRSGTEGNPYTTVLGYDAFDRLTRVNSPKKSAADGDAAREYVTRTFAYDRDGNLTRRVGADGTATTFEYTKVDQPKRVTSPASGNGGTRTTGYAYDDAARLVARVDPLGDSGDAALNGLTLGQRAACEQDERAPLTHVTGYCLDPAGRRTAALRYDASQTAASKQRVLITSYAFDARDNLVGSVDANRNSTRTIPGAVAAAAVAATQREHYDYNRVDERIARTRRLDAASPDGGSVAGPYVETYEYDPNGNLQFVHDARNASWTTEHKYDQRDQLIAEIDALGRETCTARRKDGSVLAITTPRGTSSDKDRCLTGIDPGDPATLYHEYTTVFGYDSVGDVTSRTQPYRHGQYGQDDDNLRRWKVTYERDAVGNPTTIFDARTNAHTTSPASDDPAAIHNTFYDTGELLSTNRPSWWQAGTGSTSPVPSSGGHFGVGDDVDVDVDAPQISERGGRSANASAGGDGDLPSDAGSGDLGDVSASPLPDLLPQAGRTTFAYDAEMRLTRVTDAAGHARSIDYYDDGSVERKRWPFKTDDAITHDFTYDADGNLRTSSISDPLSDGGVAATSALDYDGHDRLVTLTQPGARTSPDVATAIDEVTRFGYDQNGNLTSRETPRGTATAAADDYTVRYAYDGLDRLHYEQNPAGEHYLYGYDEADNIVAETSPRGWSATSGDIDLYRTAMTYDAVDQLLTSTRTVDDHVGETVQRNPLTTTFSYDLDGNRSKVVAPGARNEPASDVFDRITQTEYDGRGLPWKSTIGHGGGERTSLTEYDPNGNLRRSVNPAGVDQSNRQQKVGDSGVDDAANLNAASGDASVFSYDKDDLLVSTRLPWNATDTRRFRKDVQRAGDPLSRVVSLLSPYETSSTSAPRTSYTYYDSDWIHTVSNEKTTKATSTTPISDRSVTYDYDHRGDQTLWLTTGYPDSTKSRRISRTYYLNGLTKSRIARKPEGGDSDPSIRSYSYFYDENRSLSTFRDQQLGRDTVIARDPAERQLGVDEQWSGGRDTAYSYDGAGDVAIRRTDGAIGSGGSYEGAERKTTTIDHDSLGREYRMTVVPAQGAQRTTRTRWWGSGELRERVKPNSTTDRWYWTSRGTKARHDRVRSNGDVDTTDYAYDDNENRTTDERGTYEFNARDQLVHWERPSTHPTKAGYTTDYSLRGDGAITFTSERDDDGEQSQTTRYDYQGDGERLREVVAKSYAPGQSDPLSTDTTDYQYNNFNSIISSISTRQGGTLPPVDDDVAAPDDCDQTTSRLKTGQTMYCYDEFERPTFSKGYGVDDPAKIAYDGLDRRDKKTTYPATGNPVEHDYGYVGTSELLSREATSRTGSPEESRTQTYDYDSQGARQGTATDDGSSSTYHPYQLDANGSVIGLENADGSVPSNQQYLYDPYGGLEQRSAGSGDAEAELAPAAQANAFRFQGFYYDSGVKTYDMQARAYRPDIGRFLSQDQFESAIGDQVLQADALTQNRYAFAGGNPVTNVEFDGHDAYAIGDACRRNGGKDCGRKEAQANAQQADAANRTADPERQARIQLADDLGLRGQGRERGLAEARANPVAVHQLLSKLHPPPPPATTSGCDVLGLHVGSNALCGVGRFAVDLVKPDFTSVLGAVNTFCKPCKLLKKVVEGGTFLARNSRWLAPLNRLRRGERAAKAATSVWTLDARARGRAIEDALASTEYRDWFRIGAEHNGFFPLVDFQKGQALVSLKTVDPASGSAISRLQGHIRDLASSGATVSGRPANLGLDVRVPAGGGRDLADLVGYGRSRGIRVSIREFP